jgi:ribose 1,5-bisphosphokinase PhnN
LAYGVLGAVIDDLVAGRTVVLNVSRAVVDQARALGWPVTVAQVCASAVARRKRLVHRGREAEHELAGRLEDLADRLSGDSVFDIQNDGEIDHRVRRLTEVIERSAAAGA